MNEKVIGQAYPLSCFYVDECGTYRGREFITTEHYSGDRVGGSTHVQYRDGEKSSFSEDHFDPKAVYLGKGKRVITIEWPDPK